MKLYNLKDEEVEFDPLYLIIANNASDDSVWSQITEIIGNLFEEYTPGEIGRILAGVFLLAKIRGSEFDNEEFSLMRGALAALDTAMVWERG